MRNGVWPIAITTGINYDDGNNKYKKRRTRFNELASVLLDIGERDLTIL